MRHFSHVERTAMKDLKNIPNNNQKVLSMLAEGLKKRNKGRNRILFCATMFSIMILSMVFGISFGKIQAEYTKAIRQAGTTASGVLEDATESQYQKMKSLGYIKKVGRRITAGTIKKEEKTICELSILDLSAWEKITKPAYTDIHGQYPKEKQEIMLSSNTLKKLKIDAPETGMEIKVNVMIGWGNTVEETFRLSGWFTSYINADAKAEQGYISEKKGKEYGFAANEKADLLFCQSDPMKWEDVEEKLYEDIERADVSQKIVVSDTTAYDAVSRFSGSYEMSILGAAIILCSTFFLTYNVMQISMTNDVRQMGMLNTIGATKKQIRKIYKKQISGSIMKGTLAGAVLSFLFLKWGVPVLLGKQYLREYGGSKEFKVFHPALLIAAIVFSLLIIEIATEWNIYCAVNHSCIESLHYTGIKVKKKAKFVRPGSRNKKCRYKKRSSFCELIFIAWKNITRQKTRFYVSVFSIFLGVEAILCTVVITKGSDVSNIYVRKPDFTIIGEFCKEAQEAGGFIDTPKMESVDSFYTDGDVFDFMWNSYHDTFAPISKSIKEKITALGGIEQSTVAEGAFMIPVISRRGWSPVDDTYFRTDAEELGHDMVESGQAETIRIVDEKEIEELKQYVRKKQLKIDMESLENGTGVLFVHEHWFTPEQEREAEHTVGEPMKFLKLMSEEEWDEVEKTSKSIDELGIAYQPSEDFVLSGYLDCQEKGFPQIKSGWHGENMPLFLVSEKGFKRLGTEKKILYMELNVKQDQERKLKKEIKSMIAEENTDRRETQMAEILLLSKSELLEQMTDKLNGNRMILGIISSLLFLAGITNYFNVIITGIFARKQEFVMLQKIGLTKKQRRKMLLLEGMIYFLMIEGLINSLGIVIIYLISCYMYGKVTYFHFQYPVGWLIGVSICLLGICLVTSQFVAFFQLQK